jgi:HD-like signal output (HDOD) protein
MDTTEFDAVIAPAKLPGRSGVELLNDVGRRWPGLVRLMRYAPEDKSLLRGISGWPPLPMARELDPGEIEESVERALQIGQWMRNEAVRTLLPQMLRLPTVPEVYNQVMQLLASPTSTAEETGKLIAREPAITAKMLQMVNSAAFALARPITTAEEAVLYLGTERVKGFLLVAHTALTYDLSRCSGFSQERFWQHSLTAAGLARAIALAETRDATTADEAYTTALLHDLGKLLFAANLTDKYSRMLETAETQKMATHQAELLALGTSHAEFGACLLGTWGLPLRILRAIAWHHAPSSSDDGQFSLLTAVHAANVLAHGKAQGAETVTTLQLDRAYLARLGLVPRWNAWAEFAVESSGMNEKRAC